MKPTTQDERTVLENVVPAYPYDDALFSLFHTSLVRADGRVRRPGGAQLVYNKNLFHPDVKKLHGRAAAVACLFENIILAPRPLELPDIDSYTNSEGSYSHPDLRLQMPADVLPQFAEYVHWMDFGKADGEMFTEWDQLEAVAMDLTRRRPFEVFYDKHKKLFAGIGASSSGLAYIDMIMNAVVGAYLAHKHNAVLLGNDVFHELYRLLRTEAPASMNLFPEFDDKSVRTQQLNLKDVETLSLMFAPTTIDTFAAVRMDKEIRDYGRRWRKIISTSPAEDLLENLMGEMAKSYEYDSIAAKASGLLSMIGTFLTLIGFLVPGLDLAGLAVDILDKATGKFKKRLGWRLIGPRMQEVALEVNLRKYLSQKKTEPKSRRRSRTKN